MCGRFAYFGNGTFGYESLRLPSPPPPLVNYNIAPSLDILAIRTFPETGLPEYTMLRWGLVPFWSKTAKTRFPLINARVEGIEKKPSFRGPFTYRRCIIPASGFYEWKKKGDGKQPYFIRPVDGGYFALAGIWDQWQGGEGEIIESCAIITTAANGLMLDIHDRMPMILEESALRVWLDQRTGKQVLSRLPAAYPSEQMEAYPVGSQVNSPRHNGPECVEKVEVG